MKKSPSMEWRRAYPDCRECVKTIRDNEINYGGVFDVRRTSYIWLTELAVVFALTGGGLVWNYFNDVDQKIEPHFFFAVLGATLVLAVSVHMFYCFFNIMDIKACRKRVTAYQGIWPAILDVVEENEENLLLPDEPLRAEDIEVVGTVIIDESFINRKYTNPYPRYKEVEEPKPQPRKRLKQEPKAKPLALPVKEEFDFDKFVQDDETVARLLGANSLDEFVQEAKKKSI